MTKDVSSGCCMELEELKSFLDSAHDLFQGVDAEGKLIYVNKAWLDSLGYDKEEVIGKNIFMFIAPDSLGHCLKKFEYLMKGGKLVNLEVTFLTKSGGRIITEGNVVLIHRADGSFFTRGIFRDITGRREMERSIFHLATHDALTDLLNRHAFLDSLAKDLEYAKRHAQKIAIVYFDLDKFKQVNDGFGHAAGDAVLVAVANRLMACMRGSDYAVRFGGDEFGLAIKSIGIQEVSKVINRLTEAVTEPIIFNGHALAVGMSVGLAIYPDDAVQPDELLRLADNRMYEDKARQK
ncbi:MAG: sensor domain-containing diguanylate cyclase [Candidatus Moranbacteria bacterium]|nr:sensor domain-containing diguanylate cyclase [Candidatus Moranbacteria bacterium]